MMSTEYDHLIGLKFIWGEQDCAALLMAFYKDIFDIALKGFARPSDWNADELDLFGMVYKRNGFHTIDADTPVTELLYGDVLLMGIRSNNSNHCGIYVGDGNYLEHYYRQLSKINVYKGRRNSLVNMILRHKDVPVPEPEPKQTVDILDYYPEPMRTKLKDAYRKSQSDIETVEETDRN